MKTWLKPYINRSTFNALRNDINSKKDTVFKGNSILDLLPLSTKIQVLNSVSNTANSTIQVLSSSETNFETKKVWLNRHIISLHEKYVLGFACVILFFVGAPLGALIRKGGLGLPMVVAILLFLTYHFIGVFARNSAMDGTINPVIGTWLSTFIMLPLSIYLTYRATNDRGLLKLTLLSFLSNDCLGSNPNPILKSYRMYSPYSYYSKYSDEQLIEIVKNQNEFDLDKRPKQIALQHLTDRKIGLEQMEQQGLSIPEKLKQSKNQLNRFKRFSKIAFISYIVAAVCLALFFVLRNNKLPRLQDHQSNIVCSLNGICDFCNCSNCFTPKVL
jgi:lipopolysaccharide export system permease protein